MWLSRLKKKKNHKNTGVGDFLEVFSDTRIFLTKNFSLNTILANHIFKLDFQVIHKGQYFVHKYGLVEHVGTARDDWLLKFTH